MNIGFEGVSGDWLVQAGPPLLGALTDYLSLRFLLSSPWILLVGIFSIWMFIDAIRRGEYLWAFFIFVFPGLNAMLYYFLVYRGSGGGMRGFELPGAYDRRRIKELQGRIHHLDNAYHHTELGNIYFQQGKLPKAEECFRAALQREPDEIEARAHLGQCLLRRGAAAEALPLLQAVCEQDSRHEYGHSLMALAEALAALGRIDEAIATWERVLQEHSYARARVQLAELYLRTNRPDLARGQLEEAIAEDTHAPAFQRRRDRVWIRQARRQLKTIPSMNPTPKVT